MSDSCQGLFGRLFGHNFREAVNVTPQPFQLESGTLSAIQALVDGMAVRTVVAIFCTRCGQRQEVKHD